MQSISISQDSQANQLNLLPRADIASDLKKIKYVSDQLCDPMINQWQTHAAELELISKDVKKSSNTLKSMLQAQTRDASWIDPQNRVDKLRNKKHLGHDRLDSSPFSPISSDVRDSPADSSRNEAYTVIQRNLDDLLEQVDTLLLHYSGTNTQEQQHAEPAISSKYQRKSEVTSHSTSSTSPALSVNNNKEDENNDNASPTISTQPTAIITSPITSPVLPIAPNISTFMSNMGVMPQPNLPKPPSFPSTLLSSKEPSSLSPPNPQQPLPITATSTRTSTATPITTPFTTPTATPVTIPVMPKAPSFQPFDRPSSVGLASSKADGGLTAGGGYSSSSVSSTLGDQLVMEPPNPPLHNERQTQSRSSSLSPSQSQIQVQSQPRRLPQYQSISMPQPQMNSPPLSSTSPPSRTSTSTNPNTNTSPSRGTSLPAQLAKAPSPSTASSLGKTSPPQFPLSMGMPKPPTFPSSLNNPSNIPRK